MSRELLPIGSVVNVETEDGDMSLMICGRIVAREEEDKIYDYSAVPYPQGFIDEDNFYFLDNDAIKTVLFLGCQNEAEQEYQKAVANIGELKIVNGEIVEA